MLFSLGGKLQQHKNNLNTLVVATIVTRLLAISNCALKRPANANIVRQIDLSFDMKLPVNRARVKVLEIVVGSRTSILKSARASSALFPQRLYLSLAPNVSSQVDEFCQTVFPDPSE